MDVYVVSLHISAWLILKDIFPSLFFQTCLLHVDVFIFWTYIGLVLISVFRIMKVSQT